MVAKSTRTEPERFFAKVRSAAPDECWEWEGARNQGGYGIFHAGNSRDTSRALAAHVWAYEHMVGPRPEGLDLDHLCRNRACVNPAHLDPVTRSVNLARGNMQRENLGHDAQGRFVRVAVAA